MMKTARFEARLTEEQKTILQKASNLAGKTLSDFIISAAQKVAKKLIEKEETVILNKKNREIFFDSLLNPKEPNKKLKKAKEQYFLGQ